MQWTVASTVLPLSQVHPGSTPQTLMDDARAMDFSLPCIWKAAEACGSQEAHSMGIILDWHGLAELPQGQQGILQQFINHGGVINKAYVIGKNVRPCLCSLRSLTCLEPIVCARLSFMPVVQVHITRQTSIQDLPSSRTGGSEGPSFIEFNSLSSDLQNLHHGVSTQG